jgi:hypothetical protein
MDSIPRVDMIGDGFQTSPHVSASGTDDFNIGNKTIDSAVNLDLRPNPADMF